MFNRNKQLKHELIDDLQLTIDYIKRLKARPPGETASQMNTNCTWRLGTVANYIKMNDLSSKNLQYLNLILFSIVYCPVHRKEVLYVSSEYSHYK